MKKIINGRRYDTETAKELGYYWNGLAVTDFSRIEETLYRKKTGEYFLYGEGGAMSKYAEADGTGWCGGSRIIPLPIEDAKTWAEEHLTADEYEDIFGEASEDDDKITVSLRMTPATRAKLKDMAAEEGKPLSDIVEELIKRA